MTDMQIVAHRINTVERLRRLPTHWGVELDLRAAGSSGRQDARRHDGGNQPSRLRQ